MSMLTNFILIVSWAFLNAYKYTNTGGQVTINALEKNDFIEIRIEDNGIGIPESDLNSFLIGSSI